MLFYSGPGALILKPGQSPTKYVSVYVKVIGPGNRERLVKRNEAVGLVADGARPAGTMDGYECIVFARSIGPSPKTVSGQVVRARADATCLHYAQGQVMGNCYEFVSQ